MLLALLNVSTNSTPAIKLWPVMCVSSLSCDVTDIREHANAVVLFALLVGKKMCSINN